MILLTSVSSNPESPPIGVFPKPVIDAVGIASVNAGNVLLAKFLNDIDALFDYTAFPVDTTLAN